MLRHHLVFAFLLAVNGLHAQTPITNMQCVVYGNQDTLVGGTRYSLNVVQESGGCDTIPAIMVAVIDSGTCQPWGTHWIDALNNEYNPTHSFGNANDLSNCKDRVEKYFIFHQNSPSQMDSMADMLNNAIPDGYYVLIYTWRYFDNAFWNAPHYAPLFNLGAGGQLGTIDSIPYILFAQKGFPATAIETYGVDLYDVIELDTNLSCTYIGIHPKSEKAHEIVIYPNPTSGEARITNNEQGITNIEVFDLFGRAVPFEFDIQNSLLDIRHCSPGLYFVKVGEAVRKLIRN